jgi:hypothetical protein
MSFNLEHLLLNKTVRGGITLVVLPEQNITNDIKIRKRVWGLYGNTKITDEQFHYAMIKFKGNFSLAAEFFGFITKEALRHRAKIIPDFDLIKQYWMKLKQEEIKIKYSPGKGCRFTEREFKKAWKKHNGYVKSVAKELDCSVGTIYSWYHKLKRKSKRKG